MGPVTSGVEELNEGSVGVLNLAKCLGLNVFSIGDTTLDVELRFNGLITNDKFCLTRKGHIILKADQRPKRRQ